MKKELFLFLLVVFICGFFVPYKYNNTQVVDYATRNSESHSRCMCAWYVMRAIQYGGCFPCGIYPAYAYKDILPKLGYKEIHNEPIQIGDICVLSQNSKSNFGHIAIYNGTQWVSDYKQNSIFPGNAYRKESNCQYYRQTDGWHTANIWVSPISISEYLLVLFNNYKKIKI